MIGISPDAPTFLAKEKELADRGALERKKHQEMYDRKMEKEKRAAEKGRGRVRKENVMKEESEEEGTDSEACNH